MKYILDFDDTIFDAKKLKTILAKCGISEDAVSETIFDEIKKQIPDFDIQSLLFKDAYAFLKANKDNCEIITTYLSRDPAKNSDVTMRKAYQTKKIILTGIMDLLGVSHVHIVGASKTEVMKQLYNQFLQMGEKCVYVDDRPDYIAEAKEVGIRGYLMKRGSGMSFENVGIPIERYVVHSFQGFTERVAHDFEQE